MMSISQKYMKQWKPWQFGDAESMYPKVTFLGEALGSMFCCLARQRLHGIVIVLQNSLKPYVKVKKWFG